MRSGNVSRDESSKIKRKCVCACMHAQSWLTANSWNIARQAPLSMEISRQEYWSGLPLPPPGVLPEPGIQLASLMSLALAGGCFTTVPPGKH